ncbi:phosphoribosylglycinamide formyltransferase 2 [Mycolicibacterium iranicum]|uniref:Phosphoribosylglycinamide formyltransferase 2 n=1 Tax=Mycolicibacterium iranicum TaxID=912594 RepID=A0A839PYN2_MYCIR|nr:formate-dependent phosphoribosylglycinamide formyltransferase [Mycolicibacterium iranicum]MBB2988549.1 phosphoribosylglycinamide formyltransferase 2 [Mycolicibacterium iranicum]
MSDLETPHARETVMLLGAGERSHELASAFQRLGAHVVTVDAATDASSLTAAIDEAAPRYVVVDAESVPTDTLIAVAERDGVEVFPTPRAARLALDGEGLRRLAADELGLPTAPFWFAGSVEELTAVAQHAGFPLVVKPLAAAPGEGESVLVRPEDVEPAWRSAVAGGKLSMQRVLAETVVEVDAEVTLLTVRTTGPAGPTVSFCEPIGHRQTGGEALEAWQPQQLSATALDSAKSIAARIVNSLGGRGVFAVEVLVRGDEVYFSDVRPRLQDAGLVTLRSQRLSQFELHARAVLGLPVDTIMISPGAVEVTRAQDGAAAPAPGDLRVVLADALAVAESDVRVFPDAEGTLGLSLATAPDPIVARDRARRVAAALRKLWVAG